MQRSVSVIGGGRIDSRNSTWPFARLSATSNTLILKVWPMGTFSFTPEQVVSIERYVHMPFIGWGIRVNHIVPKYPEKMVFWCWGSPEKLIQEVRRTGFTPTGLPSDISYEDVSNFEKTQKIPVLIGLWIILILILGYLFSR